MAGVLGLEPGEATGEGLLVGGLNGLGEEAEELCVLAAVDADGAGGVAEEEAVTRHLVECQASKRAHSGRQAPGSTELLKTSTKTPIARLACQPSSATLRASGYRSLSSSTPLPSPEAVRSLPDSLGSSTDPADSRTAMGCSSPALPEVGADSSDVDGGEMGLQCVGCELLTAGSARELHGLAV